MATRKQALLVDQLRQLEVTKGRSCVS